jgi:hypothetical protein
MKYTTKDEILADYLKNHCPDFLPCLRNDAFGAVGNIETCALFLDDMLNDETINREDARKMLQLILRATNGLKNLLDAAVEYDEIQRKKDQNSSQENPHTSHEPLSISQISNLCLFPNKPSITL